MRIEIYPVHKSCQIKKQLNALIMNKPETYLAKNCLLKGVVSSPPVLKSMNEFADDFGKELLKWLTQQGVINLAKNPETLVKEFRKEKGL